jgi:RNA 2',3'-cyclic 3'-phosphodiesterase
VTRLARAFLAVVPSAAVLDDVAQRLEALRRAEPSLRWLPREQWHLTLQFLGPVEDAEELSDSVGRAIAAVAPFPVQLTGGGAFPSPRRATVLWIGIHEPEPLVTLADAVMSATAGLGHRAEERAYHPHLTVARAGRPRSVTGLVEHLGGAGPGPAWTVADVALVASDTRREGAVHTEWGRRPLGA